MKLMKKFSRNKGKTTAPPGQRLLDRFINGYGTPIMVERLKEMEARLNKRHKAKPAPDLTEPPEDGDTPAA